MLDPINMTLGHVDISSLEDLVPKISGLLVTVTFSFADVLRQVTVFQ